MAIEIGKPIKVELATAIENAVARHSTRCVAGRVVPYVKALTRRERQARSEIAHKLSKIYDCPAIVQTGENWAIRGEGARELALIIGGGGHPKASGSRAELPW